MTKTYITVLKETIPVYYEERDRKYVHTLPEFLETKFENGKDLIRTYIGSLESLEVKGKEITLFSSIDLDILQLWVS